MSNKKKKIIRIISRAVQGGPITNVTLLSKYLDDEFETLVLIGNKKKYEKSNFHLIMKENINFKKIKFMNSDIKLINFFNDLLAFIEIIFWIIKYKPDIIHTHTFKAGLIGRIAGYLCRVPKIYHTFHGNIFENYFNIYVSKILILLEKFLALISTRIIAISSSQKHDLSYKFNIQKPNKITLIPLGLDTQRFNLKINKEKIKNKLSNNISRDTLILGIIGRLTAIKNHSLFLECFKYVKEKSNKKLISFVIGDGEEKNNIINYCHRLNLQVGFSFNDKNKDIYILSGKDNIEFYYSMIDLMCLTSKNEGTPLSILEAGNCGIPSISTNVGGVKDIIIHKKTGILSNFSDYKYDLLDLVNDSKLLKYLSLNANLLCKNYSYENLINNVKKLYNSN